MNPDVETPSFTFRLERVRSLRERAEESAREELARELSHRVRGEALLREATHAVSAARDAGRDTVLRTGASGTDLLAAQAWMERAERHRVDAEPVRVGSWMLPVLSFGYDFGRSHPEFWVRLALFLFEELEQRNELR